MSFLYSLGKHQLLTLREKPEGSTHESLRLLLQPHTTAINMRR